MAIDHPRPPWWVSALALPVVSSFSYAIASHRDVMVRHPLHTYAQGARGFAKWVLAFLVLAHTLHFQGVISRNLPA
jgi:hypothetical protein